MFSLAVITGLVLSATYGYILLSRSIQHNRAVRAQRWATSAK